MTSAEPRAGWSAFVHTARAQLQATLIACDFDGTLAPIVADPAAAAAEPGAVAALTRLAELGCQIYVITGRPADRAVELGALSTIPRLVVLGLYGAQRWEQGVVTSTEPAPGLATARMLLDLVIAGAARGVQLEDKGLSVAVHTRQAAEPAGELDRLRPSVEGIAAATGLDVEPGRFVLELRAGGHDKGAALLASTAETAARAVLFAGDDLGDLAAFAAVRQLIDQGLAGVTVAAASAEAPQVAGAADVTVAGPPGVVALLAELAQLLE